MKILAFDLGTTTGMAWKDKYMLSEKFVNHQSFKPNRHEGGGMRFLRFREWLGKIKPKEVESVYYEEVRRHLGTDAAHIYGGFLSILTAWCEEYKIPYMGVPVGTIKKHATGKGNTNKAGMLEAAQSKLGYPGKQEDEVDALWLLDYVVKTYKETPDNIEMSQGE